MNHSVKRRRQALHQTHHYYYLNISVEAANLSDWRIESNRQKIDSVARIESNRIETFFARIGMLYGAASSSSNARENVELVRPSDTLRLRTATPGTLSDCDVTAFPASSAAAAARTTSGCSGACTRGGHVSETVNCLGTFYL